MTSTRRARRSEFTPHIKRAVCHPSNLVKPTSSPKSPRSHAAAKRESPDPVSPVSEVRTLWTCPEFVRGDVTN